MHKKGKHSIKNHFFAFTFLCPNFARINENFENFESNF